LKLCFISQDIAGSNIFEIIARDAPRKFVSCTHLAFGKPGALDEQEVLKDVRFARATFLGMSSNEKLSRLEIEAGLAAYAAGQTVYLFADLPTSVCRPFYKKAFSNKAVQVLIPTEDVRALARRTFPKAKIHAVGNPWWESFCFSGADAGKMKNKLGLSSDETFVLCAGTKSPMVNFPLFNDAILALQGLGMTSKIKIVLCLHGGDILEPRYYSEFAEFGRAIICPPGIASTDLVRECELVIQCASTTGVAAAYAGKPVIDYIQPLARSRLRVNGAYPWFLSKQGASFETGTLGDLKKITRLLLDRNSILFRTGLLMQEKHFPKIERKGEVLKNIFTIIDSNTPAL